MRRHNPWARCETPECKGAQLPLLNLDLPDDIARWNRRAGDDAAERGCHCDLEPGQAPDGCVFDGCAPVSDCSVAVRLRAEGKGRDDCAHWQPVTVRAAAAADALDAARYRFQRDNQNQFHFHYVARRWSLFDSEWNRVASGRALTLDEAVDAARAAADALAPCRHPRRRRALGGGVRNTLTPAERVDDALQDIVYCDRRKWSLEKELSAVTKRRRAARSRLRSAEQAVKQAESAQEALPAISGPEAEFR
jgi:hypothetical protein